MSIEGTTENEIRERYLRETEPKSSLDYVRSFMESSLYQDFLFFCDARMVARRDDLMKRGLPIADTEFIRGQCTETQVMKMFFTGLATELEDRAQEEQQEDESYESEPVEDQ